MTTARSATRLVAAAALTALALATPPALAAPKPKAGAQTAATGGWDVRIRRDTFGVPHILGRTAADAAYGLAYAHCEDDFATLQESIFTSRGKLASIKGAAGLPSDDLFRLMDVDRILDARYESDLSPALRHILDGYAAGVNRYAALHPDKVLAGFTAVTGRDLAAATLFRGPTFYGLDGVFAQVATGKLPGLADERGSNAVALAPQRTSDHHTRVLFNSHQPFTGPFAWWEAVVESRDGWHVAGAFFPGTPFLLGGHNEHLGWAATVNHPDLVDVYRLVTDAEHPGQYRLDGAWKAFETRKVTLDVKGADGALSKVERTYLRSDHGPVLKAPSGAMFAVRYPTSGGARALAEYWAMNKASTMAEWKAALAMRALPSINYVYGDEKGNIGFVHNGIYAEKKEGVDWSKIAPGDRSDLIWTQTRPFSQTPQIWNPKSGFLFNSNNTPFKASDPEDDLKPANFPASMGLQTDMTNRAYRALETFGQDKAITPQAYLTYKYDTRYSDRSDERVWVKEVLAADAGGDKDFAAAQAALKAWDGAADYASRGQALVTLIWLQKRQHPEWSAVQAIKASTPMLIKAFGRVDPQWREVNRLRRGALDLPVDGGPDTFRALYAAPASDGRLVALNGDGYIMFMDWDTKGKLTSRSVHFFGSATLDSASPHYGDQSPLFAAHQSKPVLFTEAQLKGQVERDYRPGEEIAGKAPRS